jgi:predicted TIM-barrel fold metal-dependent hydrolase
MAPLRTIDVDQHLFETRSAWRDHIDPAFRDQALGMEDDEHGWPWLVWQGTRLAPIEVQYPGRAAEIGEERRRQARGEAAPGRYEDLLPAEYCEGAARLASLDRFGLDASVIFPNFGLIWEKRLAVDPPAQRANMTAYNRWMAATLEGSAGRLFGVGHVTLSDADWLRAELRRLADDGIRLAMVAPAPVAGRSLAHPALGPAWQAFVDAGVTPVFHVAGFPSPLDPAWHDGDPEEGDQLLDSVFLSMAPAIAIANMIFNGLFDRFPDLRLGVVELTAGWVPSFLLHLDGAFDFTEARRGAPYRALRRRPSEYFFGHVRVAALPYEAPARLVRSVGEDTFMVGSDWPHAEGVASPRSESERAASDLTGAARDKLLGGNAAWLLGLDRR